MALIEAEGLCLDFPFYHLGFYHLGARSLKKRLLGSARLHTDPSNGWW